MESKDFRRIYIRHADKEYVNGDATLYKHDPGITTEGIEKTKMVAKHLIDQWGPPDLIISSPYKRTRETAEIMNAVLSEKQSIHIDTDIAEYLGNHRHVSIDVTESTLTHDPPHPETFSQMKDRVKSHHSKITNYAKKKKEGTIWIITHGLIIKQLASLIHINMPKDFPTLTCLSIVDGDKMTKSELLIFNDNNIDDNNIDNEKDISYSI